VLNPATLFTPIATDRLPLETAPVIATPLPPPIATLKSPVDTAPVVKFAPTFPTPAPMAVLNWPGVETLLLLLAPMLVTPIAVNTFPAAAPTDVVAAPFALALEPRATAAGDATVLPPPVAEAMRPQAKSPTFVAVAAEAGLVTQVFWARAGEAEKAAAKARSAGAANVFMKSSTAIKYFSLPRYFQTGFTRN
jgi:hypothetical protein